MRGIYFLSLLLLAACNEAVEESKSLCPSGAFPLPPPDAERDFLARAHVVEHYSRIEGRNDDFDEGVERFDTEGNMVHNFTRSFCSDGRLRKFGTDGWPAFELSMGGRSFATHIRIPERPEILELWWLNVEHPDGKVWSGLQWVAIHVHDCRGRIIATQEWYMSPAFIRRLDYTYNDAGQLVLKRESNQAIPGGVQWDLMSEPGIVPCGQSTRYVYRWRARFLCLHPTFFCAAI